MMKYPVDLVRYRLSRSAIVTDGLERSHGAGLLGVNVHASPDLSRVLYLQMRSSGRLARQSISFTTGWLGQPVSTGEWLLAKPGAFLVSEKEIASGYIGTISRKQVWIRDPSGVRVNFFRGKRLDVVACRAESGEQIANFRVFARKSFISVERDLSDAELACLAVALASGMVLCARGLVVTGVARGLGLHSWNRPVLKSRKAQRELGRRLLGSSPIGLDLGEKPGR